MSKKTGSNPILSTSDLKVALEQVLPLDSKNDAVDLDGEGKHRRTYMKIRPGLYLVVDIERDVIVYLEESSDAQIVRFILENFGGYAINRLRGFDLGPSVREEGIIPRRQR